MANKRKTEKNGTNMPEYVSETKDADTRSRIAMREELVAQARQFNLLSNMFMSVALDDKAACHDAVLDILAEDGCGRLFSVEIQRADTADPDDMSQGDLSKRIHFLKCEEGGYEIMCEVSEKIFAEGRAEGKTEGEKIGEERINKLNSFLLQEKRYGDLERSICDKEFQKQLMLQYGV